MHSTLVILAAGASSRMKQSDATNSLSEEKINAANSLSKALIGVGSNNRPLLDFLLLHAKRAAYTDVILVVGAQASAFKKHYGNTFEGLQISYATQSIPKERIKPSGTADAVLQAMEQFPKLKNQAFTVCNADNLYSVKALEALRKNADINAFISYDRDGLLFSMERISRFALVQLDPDDFVSNFIEKPEPSEIKHYQDVHGTYRVSMNIFKFNGSLIYAYLQNCPLHQERDEKELPTAILNMCKDNPKAMRGIPFKEHVPDLTSKEDIDKMGDYLDQNFSV